MITFSRISTKSVRNFATKIGQEIEIRQLPDKTYRSSLYLGGITYKFGTIAGNGDSPKKAEKSLISLIKSDKQLKRFFKKYLPETKPLEFFKRLLTAGR